jgi:hypothetical protein
MGFFSRVYRRLSQRKDRLIWDTWCFLCGAAKDFPLLSCFIFYMGTCSTFPNFEKSQKFHLQQKALQGVPQKLREVLTLWHSSNTPENLNLRAHIPVWADHVIASVALQNTCWVADSSNGSVVTCLSLYFYGGNLQNAFIKILVKFGSECYVTPVTNSLLHYSYNKTNEIH